MTEKDIQPPQEQVQPQMPKDTDPSEIQESKVLPDETNKQEHTWKVCTHLSPLINILVPFPGVSILGPLVIYLTKKADMPLVAEEAKEALNFQISMTLYLLAALISVIGIFLTIPIALANLVLIIVAAVKTSNGEKFRYPITMRLVK